MLLSLAVVAGVALAVAVTINTEFGENLGSPFPAALISCVIGSGLLVAGALAVGEGVPSGPTLARTTPGMWTGGLLGAAYLGATLLLIPRLGVAMTSGLQIAGQMVASLALDQFGGLGLPQAPLTGSGATGALLALGGAALLTFRRTGTSPGAEGARVTTWARAAWMSTAFLTGSFLPVQAAVNAQLRGVLDAPMLTGAISIGVTAGVYVVVVAFMKDARPSRKGFRRAPGWAWLGGPCAAVYVTGMLVLVPEIGAAVGVGLAIAGQQLAALVLDHFGWLRLTQRRMTLLRVGGTLALLLGVGLIQGM